MTHDAQPGGGAHAASPPLPPVIGHRGAAGRAPENTLAGFRRAKALGCSWVEFDARLTGDGGLVLCHDARLDRTTTGHGRVSAHGLAAIRRHDAGGWFAAEFSGEPVPTFDEALSLAAELGLSVNVEIKADRGQGPATAAAVAAVLARVGDRQPAVLVSSFLRPALAAMRDLAPGIPRGLLLRKVPRRWRTAAVRLGCATINVDHRALNPLLAGQIRDAGYPLLAYTVNDPQRARTLFGWGVTSVFSDVPDIILPVSPGWAPVRRPVADASFSLGMRQGAFR
ncbi:MAG: glycerophosphoryl diester phosphodiesterase [Alphaproteobacteria bacterium]|nr:glycerophosphoryl diester phosphodiesterase [Alphaproteobacteria bacterium]MBV9586076.1 glycerophosphoryl diester phosphodiesterase [Alphaproteobacteria bacterium]